MADTTVNTAAMNPYMFMNTQSSMANDVFGGKYFNGSPASLVAPNFMKQPARNKAQSIFQQYYASMTGANTAPTMQDYMAATQIASMFSANNQIPVTQTSFMQNDVFAKKYC